MHDITLLTFHSNLLSSLSCSLWESSSLTSLVEKPTESRSSYHLCRGAVLVLVVEVTPAVVGLDETPEPAVQSEMRHVIGGEHQQVGGLFPPTDFLLLNSTAAGSESIIKPWSLMLDLIQFWCGNFTGTCCKYTKRLQTTETSNHLY